MILLACLVVLLALGFAERLALRRSRQAVPVRIHVNGTRGKSTVTRLVAGALREAGIPTIAKVTGTAPRLILLDGAEQSVVRRSPASIREQAWALRKARRAGARALVVECMAVRPELQWTSERDFVQATIGVITNARLDHTEVMGETVEAIANSLSNTIPTNGTLVVGDSRFGELFAARARALGTGLVVAEPFDAPDISPDPLTVGVALGVTRELGIDDEVALRGIRKAAADPGALQRGTALVDGRTIDWIDATAANDPESLDLILDNRSQAAPIVQHSRTSADIYVYNHRADRAPRLATFATASAPFRASAPIFLTGERPPMSLVADLRRQCGGADIRYVKPRNLGRALTAAVRGDTAISRIVFCGNTRGFVRPDFTPETIAVPGP